MPTAAADPSATEPGAGAAAATHPLAPPAAGPKPAKKFTLAGLLMLIGSATGGGLVA